MLCCGIDSNENSTPCRVYGERSDESALQTTDSQQTAALKTKLEEYESIIRQQQELLLQVPWPLPHISVSSLNVNTHTLFQMQC